MASCAKEPLGEQGLPSWWCICRQQQRSQKTECACWIGENTQTKNKAKEDGLSCVVVFTWREQTARKSLGSLLCPLFTCHYNYADCCVGHCCCETMTCDSRIIPFLPFSERLIQGLNGGLLTLAWRLTWRLARTTIGPKTWKHCSCNNIKTGNESSIEAWIPLTAPTFLG